MEVAKNSKKQIQEQQIRFESVIGDDYVKQLDQTLFVKHANGKGTWDTVFSSGGKNRGISGGLLNALSSDQKRQTFRLKDGHDDRFHDHVCLCRICDLSAGADGL